MNTNMTDPLQDVPAVVLELCENYMRLNTRQAELDAAIMASDTDPEKREQLWLELEVVLSESVEVLKRLAATATSDLQTLRAKASILAVVLRSPQGNGLDATIAALALSVASDVAGLQ